MVSAFTFVQSGNEKPYFHDLFIYFVSNHYYW